MNRSKTYRISIWGLLGILGYLGFREFYLVNVFAYVGQQNIWHSKRFIVFLLASVLSAAIYLAFGFLRIIRAKSGFETRKPNLPPVFRWAAAAILVLLPGLIKWVLPLPQNFTFGYWEETLLIYGFSLLVAKLFLKPEDNDGQALLITAALVMASGTGHAILLKLCQVTSYPFTLFWSEGNRFFDYSTMLGSYRYQTLDGGPVFAFITWGMQVPWALPFIFPNLSIGAFRLWYQLVWIIPSLLLGWVAVWKKPHSKYMGLAALVFAGWTFLFLDQGPIYPPLILGALVTVLATRAKLPIGALLIALISYYVRSSRWTWAYSPGLWSALLALLEIEAPGFSKDKIKELIKPVVLGISGYFGGQILLPLLRNLSTSTVKLLPDVVSSTTRQPLLWNRLYPNPTYPPGILYGIMWASLPLVILLIVLAAKRAWKVNWLQRLSMLIISAAFLVVGLIASVKIGGGSNLHNLDNYLVTLVIIATIALLALRDTHYPVTKQPLLVILTCIALVAPVTYTLQGGTRLSLPAQETTNEVMNTINSTVDEYRLKGEILFIDQRQLLTFGMVKDVLLEDDYEKKYLMDQAMADNEDYFKGFYKDLIDSHFVLIVNEPSNYVIRGSESSFGEENDAYVKWVTIPLLCTYEPLYTSREIGVELLVPRQSTPTEAICQDFLAQYAAEGE
ncbi:hypothetical protein [Pelolinea submarina]|uniref:Glycosyltransferase RgtA/B/C/D-like domain-containing protein n=1 Tax=Pelolinea submarina TaxID=913107 RepID=A0A3E0AIX0_9CHLR|nr:hypothetical protein [Pelolinea submarina]REG11552.1 hypothetical protein DFR64_1444 [Pelolinea submarina]